MPDAVAVYGTSANPPGVHHRKIVEMLAEQFDRVLVIVCGIREDKRTHRTVDPVYRAAMADMTFGDLPKVEVLTFDLERERFTTTYELSKELAHYGTLWFVVGSDLVQGGKDGTARVQRWDHGEEIWHTLQFAVVERDGFPIEEADLPPNRVVLRPGVAGASTDIRRRLFAFEPITGLVTPRVEAYIERHGLYHGALPNGLPTLQLDTPRLLIVADERNPRADACANALAPLVGGEDPNIIAVFGGDGTMLHAIRQHWRKRLPFFGIHFGTYGFLLNHCAEPITPELFRQEFVIRHAPLLYVAAEHADGTTSEHLAFNDAYLLGELGGTAFIELTVDGQVELPRLVADGILVATAAGSSGYADSMGATRMPAGTSSIVVAASNPFQPKRWPPVELPLGTRLVFRNADPTEGHAKRPTYGFVDGIPIGAVHALHVRASKVASAELAFVPSEDPEAKFRREHFGRA